MYRAVGEDALITVTDRDTPPPSAEDALAYAAAVPCNSLLPSEDAGPCLDARWATPVASCMFGLPAPAGVTAGTWKTFCDHVASCRLSVMPGCKSLDDAMLTAVPACLDDKWENVLSYCDAHPLDDGPDAALNALCWYSSKVPLSSHKLLGTPACSTMSPMKWGLLAAGLAGGIFLLTR